MSVHVNWDVTPKLQKNSRGRHAQVGDMEKIIDELIASGRRFVEVKEDGVMIRSTAYKLRHWMKLGLWKFTPDDVSIHCWNYGRQCIIENLHWVEDQ